MGGSRSHSSAALAVVTKSATAPTAATAVRRSATVPPHSRTSDELCISRPTARNGLYGFGTRLLVSTLSCMRRPTQAGGSQKKIFRSSATTPCCILTATRVELACPPQRDGSRVAIGDGGVVENRAGPRRAWGRSTARIAGGHGGPGTRKRWQTEASGCMGTPPSSTHVTPLSPPSRHGVLPAGDEPPRCPGFTFLARHVKACAFELSRERPTSFSVARMFLSEVARPRVSNR